jgi:hypothetical protein
MEIAVILVYVYNIAGGKEKNKIRGLSQGEDVGPPQSYLSMILKTVLSFSRTLSKCCIQKGI